MSFTLEIQADGRTYRSELPRAVISGLSKLEKDHAHDIHQLVGDKQARFGAKRIAYRAELLLSLDRLISVAGALGSGFRIRAKAPSGSKERICQAVSGVLIDGLYFGIRCDNDYWKMRSSQSTGGRSLPPEMCGSLRYEPADINTDNMGIVKVEKGSGDSTDELPRLLNDIRHFISQLSENPVIITFG